MSLEDLDLDKYVDFDKIFAVIKKVLYSLLKIPYEFFYSLPVWVRVGIFIFLIILSSIIYYILYKYRWKYLEVEWY